MKHSLRYIFIALILAFLSSITGCGYNAQPKATTPAALTYVGTSEDIIGNFVTDLCNRGWNKEAAESVVNLNLPFYQSVKNSDPELLSKIFTSLGKLKDKHDVLACIETAPAIATLLSYSLDVDPAGPEKIAITVPKHPGKDQEAVLNLYGLYSTPRESIRLSEVLSRDRELVLRLWGRGELGAIPWLASGSKDGEAKETYQRWVRGIYEGALAQAFDPEALDRANVLMQIHSGIVGKLLSDGHLTPQQLDSAWTVFQKLLQLKEKDDLEWGIYCCDPRIWEFHRDFKEIGWRAYERVGSLAIDISLDKALDQCRKSLLQEIAKGNQFVMEALRDPEIRKHPMFPALLNKGLNGNAISSALFELSKLNQQGKIVKLSYWAGLKKEILEKELKPAPQGPVTWLPGYSILDLVEKKLDGRETTWLDLAFAGVDAVEVVFMTKGASKGLKLVQQGLAKKMANAGFKEAAKEITEKSSRNLYPWILRESYRMTANKLRSVTEFGMVDVTDIVRFAFEKTRMGNQAFNRITNLDARVFMRTDRRVIFDLPKLASKDHVIGRSLRVTAEGAVAEGALSTTVGQNAVESGVLVVTKIIDKTEKQTRAWNENLSIWWVAVNQDELQKSK